MSTMESPPASTLSMTSCWSGRKPSCPKRDFRISATRGSLRRVWVERVMTMEPVSEVLRTFSCRTPCDEIPIFTGMTRLEYGAISHNPAENRSLNNRHTRGPRILKQAPMACHFTPNPKIPSLTCHTAVNNVDGPSPRSERVMRRTLNQAVGTNDADYLCFSRARLVGVVGRAEAIRVLIADRTS